MQPVPRFATGGRVSFAPAGTPLGDKSAWTDLPVSGCGYWLGGSGKYQADNVLSLQDRVNRALVGNEWAANGWKPAGFTNETPAWLRSDLRPHCSAIDEMAISMANAQLGSFRQRFMTGSLPVTLNERSKPMGLTKYHTYTDNEGDSIRVEHDGPEGVVAYLDIEQVDGNDGVYVTPEFSIPLALNVLGYDRPSAKPYAAGPTKYRDATANEAIPGSQVARDTNIAKAIDLLIGADIYDQRVAANKAAGEVKAAKEAKAKRDAELNAELAATTRKLRNLSETVADFGVTAIRAEEIAEAAAKYKAAFEARAGI